MEGNKRLPRSAGGEGATDQSTVSTSDSVYSDGFYVLVGFDNLNLPLAGDRSTGPAVLRAEETTIQEALPLTVAGSVPATTNPETSLGSSAAAELIKTTSAATQTESLGACQPGEEAENIALSGSEPTGPVSPSAEAPNTQEPTSPQSGPAVAGLSQTMAAESSGASTPATDPIMSDRAARLLNIVFPHTK